ncbi:hypothetical protein PT300_00090 [Enterobacteriaceae bacterium ESL0689]|nr:hypothetical protein [Enterobacteriaceae bacterium ESL0689]
MAITTLSQLDMKAVRQTIAAVLQLPEDRVIDGNEETDISALDYFISVSSVTSDLIGEERRFDGVTEAEIITSTRETLISVNAFGPNACLIIEKLSSSLSTHYAQQQFKQIPAGIVRKPQIRNLPTAIAGGKEQRAQIDLTLSHIHRIAAPLNRGETVDIILYED